jgi:DNA (cytosine-5)-methyltransferase 1
LFAVEKEANAFATLEANLIRGPKRFRYAWPSWLPAQPLDLEVLLRRYRSDLLRMRGRLDVLAGGPPCQGFSSAGRRDQRDPRNRLFELYAEAAEIMQPAILLFENVPWIEMVFNKRRRREANPQGVGRPVLSYSERLARRLRDAGYDVFVLRECAADFGVPQNRTRFLLIGIRSDRNLGVTASLIQTRLDRMRVALLEELGFPYPVTLREAISDLAIRGHKVVASVDSVGYRQVEYAGPLTQYQALMHRGLRYDQAPNSMRLANHRPETVSRFRNILATSRKGVRMSSAERAHLGIGKESITPLAPNKPAKTVTSLPDDFIHYAEPRILTVRECARLQSFPDWFSFEGVYTTGGRRRVSTVPRYTQVANAVPPLLAQAIGKVVSELSGEFLVGRPIGRARLVDQANR